MSGKCHTEGHFIKQCPLNTAETVCPEEGHLLKDIPMTRNTVAERIDEMSSDLKQQLKNRAFKFEYLSIAIDETVTLLKLTSYRLYWSL